jgi:hypothetical protein
LNDVEVCNPPAPDIDLGEDVWRSISSMVPTVIDPNDSLRLYLLTIFRPDLPGEAGDSWDNQYLSGVNGH